MGDKVKTVKAWGFKRGKKLFPTAYDTKEYALYRHGNFLYPGESIVRVLITEIKPKGRRK